MRLKHITGSEDKIKESPYLIEEPKNCCQKWNEIFKNNNPIQIEIGMGKGNFIIEKAIHNPNINFIGIEKYPSVLLKATERLKELQLPNLRLIAMDAKEINEVFQQEIDTIYLNFSDPWPKNRHEKRRLSSETYLKLYDMIFKNKKHIIMKTDNRILFQFSVISFTEYGYHIKKLNLNLYDQLDEDNIPTEYETKFHQLGYPIYMIEVEKE